MTEERKFASKKFAAFLITLACTFIITIFGKMVPEWMWMIGFAAGYTGCQTVIDNTVAKNGK